MSVNNNAHVSVDNPFADLSSLKDANLTERETAILSKCNYENLKPKWSEGLNNISNNARTHMRNVEEVKESFFCHLGNVLGFANSEPLKEVHKVFSNFDLFDRYVRNDISPETYKKIAKANPQYFDKVIEHLEDSAKALNTKADARIGTFCSSSTGYALAKAATRFRDTADYLKRMMHGDDAAKPGNGNEKPGGQPTIINHYHNNIGHIGDNYFGDNHFGDNNFYNKGANMGVMFKKSSNGVPHPGFRPEYSISKTENLFYSPTINGKKLLELEAKDAVKLLGPGDENEGKKLEMQQSGELTFEAEPLHKNLEKTAVNSMSFTAEKRKNVEMSNPKEIRDDANNNTEAYTVKRDLQELRTAKTDVKTYARSPKEPQSPPALKEAENAASVQPKTNSLETIFDELKSLRDKYYRLWDKIHQDKGSKTALATNNNSVEARVAVFNNDHRIKNSDNSFDKLLKLGRQIENLNKTLKTLKQNLTIDRNRLSTVSPILNQIAQMIGNNKKEALEHEIPKETGKSDLADKRHGLTWRTEVENQILSEKEQKMSPDEVRNWLVDETQKTIDNIKNHLETLKK